MPFGHRPVMGLTGGKLSGTAAETVLVEATLAARASELGGRALGGLSDG